MKTEQKIADAAVSQWVPEITQSKPMNIKPEKRDVKLLGCPFIRNGVMHLPRIYHNRFGYYVECTGCGISLKPLENERLAINAWNMRQPDPRLDVLRKALSDVIKHLDEDRWTNKNGDAPGHSHDVKGRWDKDGSECEWCKTWEESKQALDSCRE